MIFSCCLRGQEEDNKPESISKSSTRSTKPAIDITETPVKQSSLQPNPHKQLSHISERKEESCSNSGFGKAGEFYPTESQGQMKKKSRKGSIEYCQKIRKRSQLWNEQQNCKLLYFSSIVDEELALIYRIIKINGLQINPLSYVLNPCQLSPQTSVQKSEINMTLIVTSKSLDQFIEMGRLGTQQYYQTIVALFSRDKIRNGDAISHYSHHNNNAEIVMMGKNCFRISSFDKIVLYALEEEAYADIYSYITKNLQIYSIQDLLKIEFVFPPWTSLREINKTLSSLIRKYLVHLKNEEVLKYIDFDVQLFESLKYESVIVVRSQKAHRDIQAHFESELLLSMNLLRVAVDYATCDLYKKVIGNLLPELSLFRYVGLTKFLHTDKKDCFPKLRELKLFEDYQMTQLQNSCSLQVHAISPFESIISIKEKQREKASQIFEEFITSVALKKSFKKTREWDDDLQYNREQSQKQIAKQTSFIGILQQSSSRQQAELSAAFEQLNQESF